MKFIHCFKKLIMILVKLKCLLFWSQQIPLELLSLSFQKTKSHHEYFYCVHLKKKKKLYHLLSACVCACVCERERARKREHTTYRVCLLPPPYGCQGSTSVIRLDGKCLYHLSHLIDLERPLLLPLSHLTTPTVHTLLSTYWMLGFVLWSRDPWVKGRKPHTTRLTGFCFTGK